MSLKPIRYPGHEPDEQRTQDQIMAEMDARFGCSQVVRTKASTPLAPPPADPPDPKRASKSSVKTEAPTKRATGGFVLNGIEQRSLRLQDKKRRKVEKMAGQERAA
jgi:hypothetical protein